MRDQKENLSRINLEGDKNPIVKQIRRGRVRGEEVTDLKC